MAISGSFSAAAGIARPGSAYSLRCDWQAQQSAAHNQSTLTCRLYLVLEGEHRINISARKGNVCTLGGVQYSYDSPAVSQTGGEAYLGQVSHTAAHADDGTLRLPVSVSFKLNATISGVYIGTVTAQQILEPDAIARASVPTLSAASVPMGTAVRVYTNRASETFTHTLRLRFGALEQTVAQGIMDTYDYVPQVALAAQIPYASRDSATLYLDTYSGGNLIGTHTAQLELTVPDTVVPGVWAEFSDTSAAAAFGCFVQNVTALAVAVHTQSAWGSPITSTAVTLGGRPYAGGVITSAGELTLAVTATDSRGAVGQWSCPVTLAAYAPPRLTLHASRCTEDGTADDTGSFARVSVTGEVGTLPGNSGSLAVALGSDRRTATLSPGIFSWEAVFPADPDRTWRITAEAADALAVTARDMMLSTGYATVDFLDGGRGIAFGAVAQKEGLTCNMDVDLCGKTLSGLPVPTADDQAATKGYADGKCYAACGLVMNSSALDTAGYGSATVIITGSLAAIHFSVKVEAVPGSGRDYSYGINRDLLQALNPAIVHITPISGGVCRFVRNGAEDAALTGFGGTLEARDQFWTPARVYTQEGSIGSWESCQLSGCCLTGVCFGTLA